MARSSGTIVAGLTAAALTTVAWFAYQASAAGPEKPDGDRPAATAAEKPHRPAPEREAHPVPADSGRGLRVVYSLGEQRVWLVGVDGKAVRTYRVAASAVAPPAGTHTVTSRTAVTRGSDGVQVEHVVRFATVGTVHIGFSAAADGALPRGEPQAGTGGIRERGADGTALWKFAKLGTKVVVVA
ncbi:L,D-transpeptidase [Streptomyces meridianus]|uniref:L,D-transpeptidase n=1 Tax=Streptomyces meridianus TaxID=2938945 RepID=A0ABT0XDA2_9ACTN|nr:L,D-transpeptidase [Streptomyces meridianus]MCM2580513.1 L,D-transpeptidase [Streptomyces meridianus]